MISSSTRVSGILVTIGTFGTFIIEGNISTSLYKPGVRINR